MTKICEYCGKPFEPKTTWQRFCTDAHRQAHFQREKQKEEKSKKPVTSNA